MHATDPKVISSSTTPMAPRTSACRNRIGPPSSRTTRSPQASLPSERPWDSVSTAIGTPTSNSRKLATPTAAWAASSRDAVAAVSPIERITYPVTYTARSSRIASARLGSLAGRSPRTTASPVTRSLTTAPLM